MWSKGNTPPLVIGVQACIVILEISIVVSQKIGNQPTSHPAITTLGHIPKESYYKDMCSTMFIAALFVIARN